MIFSNAGVDLRPDSRRPLIWVAGIACSVWLFLADNAAGAPFAPDDPSTVIAVLPDRSGPGWRAIRDLRAAVSLSPDDSAATARLVAAYLDAFRQQGDPRLLGYAQILLDEWHKAGTVPIDISLQRASLAGLQHRFDDANRELDTILERFPRHTQALLDRASLYLTRGRYAESRKACASLLLISDPSVSSACLAAVDAMTGNAERAYDMLLRQGQREPGLPPRIAVWTETLSAETAVALGNDGLALAHFLTAINQQKRSYGTPSVYLISRYSDFLIGRGSIREALAIALSAPPSDAALLRIARAKRLLGLDYDEEQASLSNRLRTSLEGHDVTHAREAAYFALHIERNFGLAASLATANWAQQKEVADASLLLEAATSLCEPAIAAPVETWLQENHIEHAVLDRARARLLACRR